MGAIRRIPYGPGAAHTTAEGGSGDLGSEAADLALKLFWWVPICRRVENFDFGASGSRTLSEREHSSDGYERIAFFLALPFPGIRPILMLFAWSAWHKNPGTQLLKMGKRTETFFCSVPLRTCVCWVFKDRKEPCRGGRPAASGQDHKERGHFWGVCQRFCRVRERSRVPPNLQWGYVWLSFVAMQPKRGSPNFLGMIHCSHCLKKKHVDVRKYTLTTPVFHRTSGHKYTIIYTAENDETNHVRRDRKCGRCAKAHTHTFFFPMECCLFFQSEATSRALLAFVVQKSSGSGACFYAMINVRVPTNSFHKCACGGFAHAQMRTVAQSNASMSGT